MQPEGRTQLDTATGRDGSEATDRKPHEHDACAVDDVLAYEVLGPVLGGEVESGTVSFRADPLLSPESIDEVRAVRRLDRCVPLGFGQAGQTDDAAKIALADGAHPTRGIRDRSTEPRS